MIRVVSAVTKRAAETRGAHICWPEPILGIEAAGAD